MPNWGDLFSSTMPVLEVVLRGTILYVALVVVLRFVGQRESGGLTLTDLLVVILVGEAAGQAMSVTGRLAVPESLVLVATMLAWSVVLDALAYRSPRLARLVKARPRPLIEDGKINHRALRRELLSRAELEAQLRLHGVRDIDDVERAYLEPNGMISVFPRRGDAEPEPEPERPPALD